jgi:hypothetical protein
MKIINIALGGKEVQVYDYSQDVKVNGFPKEPNPLTLLELNKQASLNNQTVNPNDYDVVFVIKSDKKTPFLLPNETENELALYEIMNAVDATNHNHKKYSYRYIPKTFRLSQEFQAALNAALIPAAPVQEAPKPVVSHDDMLGPLFDESDDEPTINLKKQKLLEHENEIADQAKNINDTNIDTKQSLENEINDAPANPQDKNVVPNDQQAPAFIPNPYTSIPVAVGIAATGTTVGTAFAYPGFKSLVGHGLSAKIVSGLVLVPAAAALAGGIMTNLALRAQYFLANGTQPTTEALATINETSWLAAGQLGGAFFGVEVARQGIERIIDVVAGDQWFTKLIGEYTSNVAGLGSVELKGAAMVVTGFGLGLGLMAAMIAQDVYHNYHAAPEARKAYSPAAYLAAFSIGFAIGAAASIGYSNEVASYLMPLATTTGLLMLLPVVTKPVVHGAWAAEAIKDTYTSTTTLMATKWNQWNVKSNDVTTKDIETQDEYNRKSGVPDTYTL